MEIQFHFNLSGQYTFHPSIYIPLRPWFTGVQKKDNAWDSLVFHIGLIELISYWKAACSPRLIIQPAGLTNEQIQWWKKLYFNGLGEFFYVNGLATTEKDFMQMECEAGAPYFSPEALPATENQYLVPIGGGKDSAVTLELLKNEGSRTVPLILNPRKATLDTLRVGGFDEEGSVIIQRAIDPVLLELNEKGFLNGHTPFSAMLAFYTLLSARLTGINNIALSNESSANESTVSGSHVNHQYSKSYAFEKDFRQYVSTYIGEGYRYFSFLRPLHEVQIAKIFSKLTDYHPIFRSCNAGSKTDSWCGACAKCLFAWIILEPFTGKPILKDIFGKDLMEDPSLLPYLEELSGQKPTKPFECVGTVSEVNASLKAILKRRNRPYPVLLDHASKIMDAENEALESLLHDFNHEHFLNDKETVILKKALNK
ncbi:MAG: hypothetical protein GX459_00740 [Bacteroidales bacterium]|nr:hypothetical protein [Bacteroidales bacterium]